MGKNNEENITQIGHKEDVPYHSLSPKSDKDNHKNYCEALDWALKNRKEKDIKNIAITGPYGSGKSSILKTFKETTKNKTLKFLDISLATFKEEGFKYQIESDEGNHKSGNGQNGTNGENKEKELSQDNKNNLLRLIELSILQQILYREKYTNIPDSRFKKIRSLDGKEIEKATWLLFGVICSFYLFFFHNDLQDLLGFEYFSKWLEYVSKGLYLTIFTILFYHLLKKIIVFLQRITISKLNFQNLEIQVKEDVEKSILNYHLDEILYFFEATDYNVVIIEDLDRFEQTEIFTKLREINLLINNSESIQQDVTFIYAVRDEMFKDNDRTKFFDFIIPIIPIINYSNSNEQLTRALANFNYVVSTELIDNVAFL